MSGQPAALPALQRLFVDEASLRMKASFPETAFLSIDALLAKYRHRDAQKAALVDVGTGATITFGQLADAVDSIAGQLAALGVGRGSRVILLADNSIEKVLLWIAIWRAAAVVCPLDMAFVGAAAAAQMMTAIAPALVVCDENVDLATLPDALRARVARFGTWGTPREPGHGSDRYIDLSLPPAPGLDLPAAPAMDEMAAMSCTSGTTGMPKVVVYDHAAYWLNGLASIDFLGLTASDRTLEFRSFNWYSAQILSLIPFLQTGLTLHVARSFSRSRFAAWIAGYGISVCAGVPAVINILLNMAPGEQAPGLPSLRLLTSSTAPLSAAQWERFEQTYGVTVLNLYGSSETGWICGNRPHTRQVGTVGYRSRYMAVSIVDAEGRPCPPGTQGHIVAAGAKLALGLLQADGSIAPIRGRPFTTRDLAVEDERGFIRLGGRTDDVIVRGGVKILPQEIEDLLLTHPAVLDTAVLGIPDPIYGQEVVCFIVRKPDTPFDPAALLSYGRQKLPHEKAPKQVILVDAIPRSGRGKLLRDRLKTLWWTSVQQPDDSEP